MIEIFGPFTEERRELLLAQSNDVELKEAADIFLSKSLRAKYSYQFDWLGRPIIQYPQDMVAVQQLIWEIQPDLIIETGVAHGGSLILSASMLALNALGGGPADSFVIGIDIDIRPHNRKAIESHFLFPRIKLIEGSSTDLEILNHIKSYVKPESKVLVFLDSNHTEEHVLRELNLYSPLVSIGSYIVVFDTVIDKAPAGTYDDRPWSEKDNPKTALQKFLSSTNSFISDMEFDNKFLVSVAPEGYVKRLK